MWGMFMNSKFNGDISKWDISNVENMNTMFWNSKFNSDISNWNVSKVEIMWVCLVVLNLKTIYLRGK
jgi:surface protein